MKMMSWSRYHCLPGSLLLNPRRRARRTHKTRQRSHLLHPRLPVSGADGTWISFFQFVIRLFRT